MTKSLLHLLHLTDPALPIGGFAHSAGLETYVQKGIVKDKASATEFVVNQLSQNIHFTDAAFVSLAYDAARKKDWKAIQQLDEECTAVKLPREMREGSQKLGLRLLKIFAALHRDETGNFYYKSVTSKVLDGHYCLAFGIFSAALDINKIDAITGFYYNAAAGTVTNCVKLVPLGQQEGQEILFSLQRLIKKLAEQSLEPDKQSIGLCCSAFDIRSMQHETLYSRLYMS